MEVLLAQTCVSFTRLTARLTSQALITMKLMVLMWSLLATLLNTSLGKVIGIFNEYAPPWEKDHPSIHQDNLNGSRPMLMKSLSKLVVPNLSPLWMDILSLSSSRMVWPMPPPLEDPQITIWTHIHMSSSPLLMNGIPQFLTMILHLLMDWTPVKCLDQPFGDPMFDAYGDFNERNHCQPQHPLGCTSRRLQVIHSQSSSELIPRA